MGDFNSVLLKRQFDVAMSIEALNKIISSYNSSDYSITQLGNSTYKVVANISFGTGMVFGIGIMGLFNGIKIYASLKSSGPTQTTITFTSRLRFELYVLIVVSIVLSILILSSNYASFFEALICPLILVWFWALYRYQEKKLADDFEYYLAKQPRMGWPDLK